ncbi:MAG: hypothetical protein FWE26_03950 [Coriobacteriia bacterium]|nr:hypothetical protein [Coriobacteriia bacterium]
MHRQDISPQTEAAQNLQASNQPSNQPDKRLVTIASHGITVQVDQDKFNDLELFDMIDEIQSGNVFKMPKLMRRIFDDQHQMVLNGLREENGIVTADKASEFLVEVLQQIGPNS